MTTQASRAAAAALAVLVLAAGSASSTASDASHRRRLPEAVARAVDANKAGAEIGTLEIEKEEGITLYDIEFKGDAGEIEVAEDGTVLDVTTIVGLAEVPGPAAAVIERAARGHAIKRVERSEVRCRITKDGARGRLSGLATPEYVYEAEFVKGGEIEVAADGRIIKAPKFMGKASPPEK